MIKSQLDEYLRQYPEDEKLVSKFKDFISRVEKPFARSCLEGHLTGSAIILNPQKDSVVLLHHKKLGFWMQPGGHADGDEDLERVARKEAGEETGLTGLLPAQATIVGLSIHTIPARADVPEHSHYDVRFAFVSPDTELMRNSESNDLNWFPISSLTVEAELQTHIQRAYQLFKPNKKAENTALDRLTMFLDPR